MKLNSAGQSLVELIVAIAVIQIGIFAVWSLFLVNFNAEREAEMRIVGVNLAREGVEVVKNIRDGNWLKNGSNVLTDREGIIWPWDESLSAGSYAVNFDSSAPADVGLSQLYIDSEGFYSSKVSSRPSPFVRTVSLNDICCDDADDNLRCDNTDFITAPAGVACPQQLKIGINVVSDVSWQISGNKRHAIVEDNLFNWK